MTKEKIYQLAEEYNNAAETRRAEIINAITYDDSEKIRKYTKKLAELAVQQNKESYLVVGLLLQVMENAKLDFRDNIMQLSLLYHSAKKIGIDADKLFLAIAQIAADEMQRIMLQFLQRSEHNKSIEAMGFREVLTPCFHYYHKYYEN
ncbi:MAG: hypothetical protein R2798_05065 [Chitinophagales bacterium]|nr:hypothetical protein [Bacteroidota bacterium]MCB9042716.1 hypothetical protein [Chitinophagales bacterium]